MRVRTKHVGTSGERGVRQRAALILAVMAVTILLPSAPSGASHTAHQWARPEPPVPGVTPPGVVKAVCIFSGGHIRDASLGTTPVHGHLGWFASQLHCEGTDRYSGTFDFEFDFDTDGATGAFRHGETCDTGHSTVGTLAISGRQGWAGGWANFDRSSRSSLTMWGFLDHSLGPDDYISLQLSGAWCSQASTSTTGRGLIWGPANSAPEGPWLEEPRNGHAFAPGEEQMFRVTAWDYENDPWSATIVVRDASDGTVVREFVVPTSDGFSASGSPSVPLPSGNYSWTATATDVKGAESAESDPEDFSVQ